MCESKQGSIFREICTTSFPTHDLTEGESYGFFPFLIVTELHNCSENVENVVKKTNVMLQSLMLVSKAMEGMQVIYPWTAWMEI